jgi:hypothetical protein
MRLWYSGKAVGRKELTQQFKTPPNRLKMRRYDIASMIYYVNCKPLLMYAMLHNQYCANHFQSASPQSSPSSF